MSAFSHLDLGHDVVDEDEPAGATATAGAAAAKPAPADDVVDEDAAFDPDDRLPAHALRQPDGSVVLPLRYPRVLRRKKNDKVTEQRIEALHLHRLTGADQRAAANTSNDMMIIVALTRSTRLPQVVMAKLYDIMDAADTAAASQVIVHFFANGRTTGKPD